MCDESRTVSPPSATERVERSDRLVEHEQLRSLGQRERQRDLGLLSARESVHLLAQGNVEASESLAGEAFVPMRVQLAAHVEHFGQAEAAVQRMLLRDEPHTWKHDLRLFARRPAEHAHFAGARLAEPDQQVKECRLAGPVRADERGDRAGRNREGAVAQSPPRPVPLTERMRLDSGDDGHAASSMNADRTTAAKSAATPSSSKPAS